MIKKRIVFDTMKAKEHSPLGRIIVLTGARQTGKTTLSRHGFPHFAYLSIEDPVQVAGYRRLTAQQWKALYPSAILDEVQKEPQLIESIKSVYDQFSEPRYILLGSSRFLLMSKVRESLAGRCFIMEIYPLTLPELATDDVSEAIKDSFFVRYMRGDASEQQLLPTFTMEPDYARKQQVYDYYLQYGGYPALTNEALSDTDRMEWLEIYVRTFLERDVRDLGSFRDLEPFIKLQRYLAHTTGSTINLASIAKETAVSIPTIQRYLQYMEMSYQTLLLPAWFVNPVKRLTKAPKVHFMDYGVLQAVLKKRARPSGNEYESIIITEIYKQLKSYRLPVNCYHLRTQDGREVDLLLETADSFIAIEVKMTANVGRSDIRNLTGLQEILNKPLRHAFVLSNDPNVQHFGEGITAVHAAQFLG
ncbi:MAG: ATP-binding protein [Prevotellaceae bacterium]|jgi:predicted AAA+ superfamily ATPase|nr:ATP-binding protein [Prevotellaceae bacterium]